jgi:predicted metalloprotease
MRWTPGGRSKNLEDDRGAGSSGGGGGGGFGGGRRIGLGGLVVLIALSVIFKKDFVSGAVGLGGGSAPGPAVSGAPAGSAAVQDPAEEQMVLFMSNVLDSAQIDWSRAIPNYRDAKLRLFRTAVQTDGCGPAEAASGPFYCPADQRVYLDLSFFDQLKRQFGAPGDFAQAYVLAHEIGHHVQNLLGTERELRSAQQRNPGSKNQLSVAMELQADCYAGVFGYHASRNGQLEAGDLEEGLSAASAVGDDRLQKMSGDRVNRETFTHGSSADRMKWFKRGFDSGDPKQCDTFASAR